MSENTDPQVNDQDSGGARDGAADLGDAGKKALEAERAENKELRKQLKEFQSQLDGLQDAGKSDAEKLQRKYEKAQQELDAARSEIVSRDRALLIREVADEVGLPARLAARVQGDDRDAMLADAKELLEVVVPEGPRKPAPVPEAGRAGGATPDPAQQFEDFMSQSFN